MQLRGHCLGFLLLAACGSSTANQPPELESFGITTIEDQPVTANVAASDPDDDLLTLVVRGQPAHGSVTVADLAIVYTPAANYNGPDTFMLAVSDGTAEIEVMVDITVTAANDQPVGGADILAATEDTPRVVEHVALLQNDGDIENDSLTIVGAGNAIDGIVTVTATDITFTPNPNFEGNASFNYTLSDGTTTSLVVVTVNVGGVNDAPIANDDAATADEDTTAMITTLLANDTDIEGQVLSITAVGSATNGTVALVDAMTVAFTPAANFNGTASFAYTMSDGVDSDSGIVTLTVNAINDAPIALDDNSGTRVNVAANISHASLLANDNDGGDGGALTITAVQNAQNGTATLNASTITFAPTTDFVGSASFEYVVSDGTDTDVAVVNVNVTTGPAAAKCADIVTNTPVWGLAATGIDFRTFTNSTLHWIGCAGNNGCAQSTFFCTDNATSLHFGTTASSASGNALRALVDPGNALGDAFPTSFQNCCSSARPNDICNAPDSNANAAGFDPVTAMCRSLGYSTGTIVREVNTNFCPKPHALDIDGQGWTSNFVTRDGYAAEYRCDL